MFSEPATGNTPDEQPGAMPEIFPSPDQGPNIDRCWTCRSMFMQAWGNYGTAWAVVHQWLGVQPQLGRGEIAIDPQVPAGQDSARRTQHPARERIGGRHRQPYRQPVHHRDRRSGRWGGQGRRDRAHPAARSGDRVGVPGRLGDLELRDSSDEPRPRGDSADRPGSTPSRDQHGWLAQFAVTVGLNMALGGGIFGVQGGIVGDLDGVVSW